MEIEYCGADEAKDRSRVGGGSSSRILNCAVKMLVKADMAVEWSIESLIFPPAFYETLKSAIVMSKSLEKMGIL